MTAFRKGCAVVALVAAGFFLMLANLMAFVVEPILEHGGGVWWLPWAMVGVPLVVAVAAWGAGWALHGCRDGARLGSRVLLSITGFNLFLILTMACMYFSPAMRDAFAAGGSQGDPMVAFSHPWPGLIFLGVMAALGGWTYRKAARRVVI